MGQVRPQTEGDTLAAQSQAEALAKLVGSEDALESAKEIARKLLKVKSNAAGGTESFRQHLAALKDLALKLPEDPCRGRVLESIEEAKRSFVGKTPGTWRPSIRQASE